MLGIDPDKIPGPNDDQQTQTHNSTLTAAITIDDGITPVCGEPFNVTVILTNTGRTALTGGTLNFRDLHPASGNERSNMSAQFPILNPGQQSPPIHFTGVMTDIHYNEQHKLQAIVDRQVIGELSYVLQQGNCNPTINNVITPVPVTVPIVVNFSYNLNDITCGDGLYTIALTNLTTGAVSYQWAIEYYEVRVFRNQNGGFDHASPGTAFVSREVFSTETNPILTIKDVYRNGGFNIKVILTAYSNVGSPKSYSEDIIGQWLGWNGCAVAH